MKIIVSMIRKYHNHLLQTNPQHCEVEQQNTKSYKTTIKRYKYYTDPTRSANMIKQQPSGLCTLTLYRYIQSDIS